MRFDPMTGEPINEEVQETIQYDPMTGQPIGNTAQANTQYDPMTGQPIGNTAQPNTQYDPMTGQPIGNTTQANTQYDPMTGQPIGNTAQPNTQYDPMTGQPIKEKKSKNTKLPKILGIAVIAVAAVVLVAAVLMNALQSNASKVCVAFGNTFKDMPHIVEDIKPIFDIASSNKMTFGLTGGYDENQVTLEFLKSGKEKQVIIGLDGEDVKDFELIADIDSKKVSFYAPKLDKRVFAYYYTKENDGFIADMLDDDIDALNDLCSSIYKEDDTMKKFAKDMLKIMTNEIKKADFEKIDSEYFEINDKDVKCKGYQLKIDEKLVSSVLKSMQAAIKAEYKDYFNGFIGVDGDYDIDEVFEELIDSTEDMEEIEASFYINGNKLAAIILEGENDDEITIEFRGGDYRAQNITITQEYENGRKDTLKMKGSISDGVEKLKISDGDSEILSVKYDYKSGDVELELDDSDYSISGNLKASSSEVVFEIEEIESYGMGLSFEPGEASIYAKKNAKFSKLSGKEYDLGNADEDDLEDLADDLYDAIEDAELDDFVNILEYMF